MSSPAFSSELRNGVLFVTLDTPGSAVNVLTREAAMNLCTVLREIDAKMVHAVVLRSGKARSFLNGVGLMLVGTIKSAEDAARVTAPIREAYAALRACPVPTIAAIRGNCYGCGVEMTLHCRYRLAADTFDTHFYMTELADYLLIPTFGSTQDLPRLIGLEHAADLLLWGKRWSARRAEREGLVDACFDPDVFDREVEGFAQARSRDRNLESRSPARQALTPNDHAEVRRNNLVRIRRLPTAYRELYGACFELMDAATTMSQSDAGYAREAVESARWALAPLSRSAQPFFFIRQMAKGLAVLDKSGATAKDVKLDAARGSLPALGEEIARRRPEGSLATELIRMVSYDPTRRGDDAQSSAQTIDVSDRVSGESFDGRQGATLHAPLRALGVDVVEVAHTGDSPSAIERLVSSILAERYFTALRTRPRELFVLDDLLAAWLAPQVAYLLAAGSPGDLACGLRRFGFTRLAGDWVRHLDLQALCKLVTRQLPRCTAPAEALRALPGTEVDDGRDDPVATFALLASLGGFVARMLRDGCLPHPSVADVAARDVVDFPLMHTSLCRYLTLARVSELIASEKTFCHLVPAHNLSSLKEFFANGREFYQGSARQ